MRIRGHVDYSSYGPARKPGVARKGTYRSPQDGGRKWSAEEEAILRRMFGTVASSEIAEKLGRTTRSVNHRASVLGLKK